MLNDAINCSICTASARQSRLFAKKVGNGFLSPSKGTRLSFNTLSGRSLFIFRIYSLISAPFCTITITHANKTTNTLSSTPSRSAVLDGDHRQSRAMIAMDMVENFQGGGDVWRILYVEAQRRLVIRLLRGEREKIRSEPREGCEER